MPARFDLHQLAQVSQALRRGESLVSRHYRIPQLPSGTYPYEVATLADLEPGERAEQALAHLVVYERQRRTAVEHLYRICLQDDAILGRVQARGEARLAPLLVYILTHELVHVVRFQRAEQSFSASRRSRRREEDRVHQITLGLLEDAEEPEWRGIAELLGNPVVPARLVLRS